MNKKIKKIIYYYLALKGTMYYNAIKHKKI